MLTERAPLTVRMPIGMRGVCKFVNYVTFNEYLQKVPLQTGASGLRQAVMLGASSNVSCQLLNSIQTVKFSHSTIRQELLKDGNVYSRGLVPIQEYFRWCRFRISGNKGGRTTYANLLEFLTAVSLWPRWECFCSRLSISWKT